MFSWFEGFNPREGWIAVSKFRVPLLGSDLHVPYKNEQKCSEAKTRIGIIEPDLTNVGSGYGAKDLRNIGVGREQHVTRKYSKRVAIGAGIGMQLDASSPGENAS